MNTSENYRTIQNTSDEFSNLQNTSEGFSNVQRVSQRASGVGRGKKYPGAEIPADEQERANFSLIMGEAYALFENAGERRSVRMIAEYCKTGELICYYDSDDKRWHITQESVQSKIGKIKALNARQGQGALESSTEKTSEHFSATQKSSTPAAEPHTSEEIRELEKAIKELNQENMDLKITNRGKDYFIEQLQKERDAMITKIEHGSRLIGQLQTKLLQLEPPKHSVTNQITDMDGGEVTYETILHS